MEAAAVSEHVKQKFSFETEIEIPSFKKGQCNVKTEATRPISVRVLVQGLTDRQLKTAKVIYMYICIVLLL